MLPALCVPCVTSWHSMNLPTKGNCSDGSSLGRNERTDLNPLIILEDGDQGQGTRDFFWGLPPCLSQPFPSLVPMGLYPSPCKDTSGVGLGPIWQPGSAYLPLQRSRLPGQDLSAGSWRGTVTPQTGSGCAAHAGQPLGQKPLHPQGAWAWQPVEGASGLHGAGEAVPGLEGAQWL